jgi:hypothetical protein
MSQVVCGSSLHRRKHGPAGHGGVPALGLANVSLVPRFQVLPPATRDSRWRGFAHCEQLDCGAAGTVMAFRWLFAAHGSGLWCLGSARRCGVVVLGWRMRRKSERRPCWCCCRTCLLLAKSEVVSLRKLPQSEKRGEISLLSSGLLCRCCNYWCCRRRLDGRCGLGCRRGCCTTMLSS